MQLKELLPYMPAIAVFSATFCALAGIYFTRKNSRHQIKANKLEELYEAIQTLSGYYSVFELLHHQIGVFRQNEKQPFDWMLDYHKKRDQFLPEADRMQIQKLLSRIEILATLYTSGKLEAGILDYQDLLYWFSDKVFDGSSRKDILIDKKPFPSQQEFMIMVQDLKRGLLKEIKK